MRLATTRQLATEILINGEVFSGIDQITMRGLETFASFLQAPYNFDKSWMCFVAIGSGEFDVSSDDRTLENEVWRKQGSITQEDNILVINAVFGQYEPEDDYWMREVGLFDSIAGSDLGARWSLDTYFYKDGTDQVDVTCRITVN